MKIETTIALEPELWHELNRLLPGNGHHSLTNLIEDLLRRQLEKMRLPRNDESESAKINANADRLNQEAEDVLDYQVEL